MRRNRKNNIKRERAIMIASSAFVLAALTMTGIYMRQNNKEDKDDGYTIDFTALENSVDDQLSEFALNSHEDSRENMDSHDNNESNEGNENMLSAENVDAGMQASGIDTVPLDSAGDDLDYFPMNPEEDALFSARADLGREPEAGKALEQGQTSEQADSDAQKKDAETPPADLADAHGEQAASGDNVVVAKSLHFSAESLLRPISGEILLPYSMNGSIYFSTLKHYRYNPAVIYSADVGSSVLACADAKVVNIFTDPKIGNAMTLDLGDGYQVTYGQLKNIQIPLNEYVQAGEVIAEVAEPTKYYSTEGSNLYFEMKKDGDSINPEEFY